MWTKATVLWYTPSLLETKKNRLPMEAVDAPSFEVFKLRLDGALSQSGLVVGIPACSRGWN